MKEEISALSQLVEAVESDPRTHYYNDRVDWALEKAHQVLDDKELLQLRELCATAYQIVGVANGPVELLDNLSAAANGESLPHDPGAGLPWIPDNDRYSDSQEFLVSVCLDGYDSNEEMVKHCGADEVYEALSDYGFNVNFVNKT